MAKIDFGYVYEIENVPDSFRHRLLKLDFTSSEILYLYNSKLLRDKLLKHLSKKDLEILDKLIAGYNLKTDTIIQNFYIKNRWRPQK